MSKSSRETIQAQGRKTNEESLKREIELLGPIIEHTAINPFLGLSQMTTVWTEHKEIYKDYLRPAVTEIVRFIANHLEGIPDFAIDSLRSLDPGPLEINDRILSQRIHPTSLLQPGLYITTGADIRRWGVHPTATALAVFPSEAPPYPVLVLKLSQDVHYKKNMPPNPQAENKPKHWGLLYFSIYDPQNDSTRIIKSTLDVYTNPSDPHRWGGKLPGRRSIEELPSLANLASTISWTLQALRVALESFPKGSEKTLRNLDLAESVIKRDWIDMEPPPSGRRRWYLLVTTLQVPLTQDLFSRALSEIHEITYAPDYKQRILDLILPPPKEPVTREGMIYKKWDKARENILRARRVGELPDPVAFPLLQAISIITLRELNLPPEGFHYPVHLKFVRP